MFNENGIDYINKYKSKYRDILIEMLDWVVHLCEVNNLDYFIVGGTLLGAVRHKGFIPWDDDIDISLPRKDYEKLLKFIVSLNHRDYFLHNKDNDKHVNFLFSQVKKNNTYLRGNPYFLEHCHHGISIDLFPLDKSKISSSFFSIINAYIVRQILLGILIYRSKRHLKEYMKIQFKREPLKGMLKLLILMISIFLPRSVILKLADFFTNVLNKTDSGYYVNLTGPYSHHSETNSITDYYPVIKLEFEGKLYNAPNNYDAILTRLYGNYMELPDLDKRLGHSLYFVYFGDTAKYEI